MKSRTKPISYLSMFASMVLFVGAGCGVTPQQSTELPEDPADVTEEQMKVAEAFIDKTYAPEEFLGTWDATDLGKTIVFDTGSDRSLGTFHIDDNGTTIPGFWYVFNNILVLQTQDQTTLDKTYMSAKLKGDILLVVDESKIPSTWNRL